MKCFWIFIVANKLFNFNVSRISNKSKISLPLLLIKRPSKLANCYEEIRKRRVFFKVWVWAMKELLYLYLSNIMVSISGYTFYLCLFSQLMWLPLDFENCLAPLCILNLSQTILQNSFVRPLLAEDLFFGIFLNVQRAHLQIL